MNGVHASLSAHPDPTAWPLTTQARLIRSGDLSAQTLLEHHLARIDRLDPTLRAFLRLDRSAARAQAAAVDHARTTGAPLGPLAGIPIAIKDQICTAGLETTAASKILAGWVPPYDATVVTRLRQAGAIILGKTNQDELGMGSTTEASAFYPTRNPWDLTRVPGGSSGGSAAAVSARLASAALGTDTGGSIRQPASFCGLVGLKPTYGRVSRHGVIAYASSLDQVGPLTRTVADAALLFHVLAGSDPRDATCLPLPPPSLDSLNPPYDLGGLRIGIPAEYHAPSVDPDVRSSIDRALTQLTELGATLVPISLPHTPFAVPTYYLIAMAEAASNLARLDGIRYGHRTATPPDIDALYAQSRAEGFGPEVKRRILLGTFALAHTSYEALTLRAHKARTLILRDFDAAFQSVDLIAGPVAPEPASPLGHHAHSATSMYLSDIFTVPASLAGLPALSLPIAPTPSGLPVGLQLIAPALNELRLLYAASALEAEQLPALPPDEVTP